jgi:hypothetical protein
MPDRTQVGGKILYGAGTLLAICVMAFAAVNQPEQLIEGRNDFMPLYTGARLLDEGRLYDNERLLEREAELTGFVSDTHGYIRPPFLAAMMWPLSRLPYRAALRAWQVASLSAVLAFVWLWDRQQRRLVALATFASIPVLIAWLAGQDIPFLLLVIAVCVRLHQAGRPMAAGAIFALCAAKPHLFLLTPIWILGLRDREFLKGLLLCGAALAAISTVVAGWSWPIEMFREATNPRFSPSLSNMPNLHGALSLLPASAFCEILVSAAAAGAVFVISIRSHFLPAFAAGLLGGMLLARHNYVMDLAILIPALLIILRYTTLPVIKIAAAILLAPPLMLMALQHPSYAALTTALCWLLLVGWAWEWVSRERLAVAAQ